MHPASIESKAGASSRRRRRGATVPDYLSYVKDLDCEIAAANCPVWNLADSGAHPLIDPWVFIRESSSMPVEHNAWGSARLTDAIANAYGVRTECVRTAASANTAYYLLWHALTRTSERRHVMLERPRYQPLENVPASFGLRIDLFDRERGLVDPAAILRTCAHDTAAVVVTNPHNPSGVFVTDDVLIELARELKMRGVLLIIDEVFRDLAVRSDGENGLHRGRLVDEGNIAIISSLSKAYGLAALKCGWVLANPELIANVRESWVLVENTGSALLEAAAANAISNVMTPEHRGNIQRRLAGAREKVRTWLLENPGVLEGDVPDSGCLYFPRVAGVQDTVKLADALRREGVYVVPGEWFEAPGYLRLAIGGTELDGALARIAAQVRSING